ncbi:ATP-binding protein [Mycoplana dimorpha]|uniref:Uncharacterized protein YhaN n=1 Tax=Mycoplana dimorpha TaxID=28320 RepID=A0A2T5BIQ7_MYCDI|nr:AAA family ATPase [Mycoplana dimorpha]PTM98875.1 uncharacterized protein YhaN [Mycoplana dimorpha]
MRLNRLDLARYGKFTDKRLDFGEAKPGTPDFHLVYGPNEAGKSTLFSAYLDLLFGIETQSAYGFLHPYPTMRVGGDITVGADRSEVARLKRRQGSLIGPDERVLSDALFTPVLGSMDRQAYQMMFSLDDDSIERGGEAILKSEGELGALLFSASSGLSGIGSGLDQLKAEADLFFRPQARKHELGAMKAEIEALREERKALNVAARDYGALTRQLETSTAAYDKALEARAATQAAIDEMERRLSAMPLLKRLRDLRVQLGAFDLADTPPKEWTPLVSQLMVEEAELSARAGRLDGDLERRRAALDGTPSDPEALAAGAEIAALAGSALEARYRTAQMDLAGRIAERDRIDAEIAEKRSLLGLSRDIDPVTLVLPPDKVARLSTLVAERSGLDERLVAARREAEEAVHAHEAARGKLAGVAEGEPSPDADEERIALLAMVRAAKQGALSARLRDAEREKAIAEAGLAAALGRLAPWQGNSEALLRLDAPGRDAIDALRQAIRRHADAAARTTEQVRTVTLELAGQRAVLERMRRSEAVVSDEEASALRRARDAAWNEHRQRLDPETADRFEAAMQRDDTAGLQRMAQADRLSEMRLTERSIAENEARLTALQMQFERIGNDATALASRIEAIAMSLGTGEADMIEAGAARPRRHAAVSLGAAASSGRALAEPADGVVEVGPLLDLDEWLSELDAIEGWVDDRAAALEAADVLSERRAGLAVLTKEARELAGRLSHALKKPERIDVSAAAVDELLVQAEDHATALGERLAQRRNALEALALAQERRSEREAARQAAEAAVAAWQAAWDEACHDTWLSSTETAVDVSRASALLPLIHAVSRLVESRRELDRRIEGMRRDQADYARMAERLAERIGGAPEEDPLAFVSALSDRVRLAKEAQAQRERQGMELARLEEEAAELDSRLVVHARRSRDICEALGCETLAQASFALQRYRERDDLRERADEAAQDLCRRMLAATADEAEAALAATDESEVTSELAQLRARHEDQDREVREMHAARIKAADALAAIGADGSVAALEERRRTLILDLAERAKRYLATRAGIAAAEAALRLYRERHRSAMMRHASDAFRTISGGEYSGLSTVVEKDQEILVATAAAGGSKLARELSKGTRFQLYLALRVAGYHEVAANREILPFIADDIMETFDDNRSLNAFRLMAEMSRVGQVIYLTHHQHLCDIARQACPQVVIHKL